MVSFGNLAIGKKFYRIKKDGTLDLRLVLIKIGPIKLAGRGPWTSLETTQNVIDSGEVNCVIIGSPNDAQDGTYDYMNPRHSVYPASGYVC